MPILGIISSQITGHLFTPIGYSTYSNDYTVFTKFNLNAETTSTVTLTSVTNIASAYASNSGVAGYLYGTNATPGTACQKISYSNDSVSTLANSLPQERRFATGQSNSGTAGYVTGGATAGFIVRYKTIVKSPFSTDTPATLGTGFTDMGNGNAACSNNHTAGYTFGGYSDTTGDGNWINKINYSNDAISNSVATLAQDDYATQAFSNDGTAAYVCNGQVGGTAILKLTYSNDTRSTISATMPDNTTFMAVNYKYQTAGYWMGGIVSGSPVSSIQKLLYSGETRSTISATLATAGRQQSLGEMSNNGVI